MNNLAMLSLKYGNFREAMQYLKKALGRDSSYSIARVNLATLFVKQADYANSYVYYRNSYKDVLGRWSSRDQKRINLLNNYAVALTYLKKWEEAENVFNKLVKVSSPQAEILLNYSLFLTEKSKREAGPKAKQTLLQAKEILDELALYSGSPGLKSKLRRVLNSVNTRLRNLRSLSSKAKSKGVKRRVKQ